MGKAHRATGNPRGRPPKIPFDFGQWIIENLRQRVDPKTGLVRPRWKQMARELGVSRSTIARQMTELYACGAYKRIAPSTMVRCAAITARCATARFWASDRVVFISDPSESRWNDLSKKEQDDYIRRADRIMR